MTGDDDQKLRNLIDLIDATDEGEIVIGPASGAPVTMNGVVVGEVTAVTTTARGVEAEATITDPAVAAMIRNPQPLFVPATLDVDPGEVVPLEVWPLYRDPDCEDELEGWIVEGTDDEAVARRKVELFVEPEESDREELLVRLRHARVEVRSDWRWDIDTDGGCRIATSGPGEKFTGVRFWA